MKPVRKPAAGRKRPIRVVIIDDSATMRGLMAHALRQDPDIEVAGYAGDAYGAREAIKTLEPDCVTLDIEMPMMDGLTFLEKLMRLRPIPVVVVTSKTESAEDIEVAALELGAAHCLFKPKGGTAADLFGALPGKIKQAVDEDAGAAPRGEAASRNVDFDRRKVIMLGASTGGVDALVSVLKTFPANCPPTLVVQHMPQKFIPLFVQRLNNLSPASVALATSGAKLAAGQVLVAPAGRHLRLSRKDPGVVMVEDTPPVNGFVPSVDVLFRSGAQALGQHCVAALLTGMGRDGAQGLLAIKAAGGATFAQDEATSIVYGMPRVATEIGAVDTPLPLGELAKAVLSASRKADGDGR